MMHNNYSSLVLHQQIHPHTLQTTTHSFPTTVLGNEHEGIETKKHADIFVKGPRSRARPFFRMLPAYTIIKLDHHGVVIKFQRSKYASITGSLRLQVEYYNGLHRGKSFPMEAQGFKLGP